jgi:hypothetical protein
MRRAVSAQPRPKRPVATTSALSPGASVLAGLPGSVAVADVDRDAAVGAGDAAEVGEDRVGDRDQLAS